MSPSIIMPAVPLIKLRQLLKCHIRSFWDCKSAVRDAIKAAEAARSKTPAVCGSSTEKKIIQRLSVRRDFFMTVRRISLQSIRTQVGRGAAHFARISHHRGKKLLKNFNFFAVPVNFWTKKLIILWPVSQRWTSRPRSVCLNSIQYI